MENFEQRLMENQNRIQKLFTNQLRFLVENPWFIRAYYAVFVIAFTYFSIYNYIEIAEIPVAVRRSEVGLQLKEMRYIRITFGLLLMGFFFLLKILLPIKIRNYRSSVKKLENNSMLPVDLDAYKLFMKTKAGQIGIFLTKFIPMTIILIILYWIGAEQDYDGQLFAMAMGIIILIVYLFVYEPYPKLRIPDDLRDDASLFFQSESDLIYD